MFGRHVTMKLKVNSAAELTRINQSKIIPLLSAQKGFRNESLFIAPGGLEAIANNFWDTKEDAEAHNRTGYPEVLELLSTVLAGTPIVESFELADSTFPKAFAKTA